MILMPLLLITGHKGKLAKSAKFILCFQLVMNVQDYFYIVLIGIILLFVVYEYFYRGTGLKPKLCSINKFAYLHEKLNIRQFKLIWFIVPNHCINISS